MKTSQEGKPDQDQHLPGQQQPLLHPSGFDHEFEHGVTYCPPFLFDSLKLTENLLACQGLSKTSHFRDIRVEVLVEACPGELENE